MVTRGCLELAFQLSHLVACPAAIEVRPLPALQPEAHADEGDVDGDPQELLSSFYPFRMCHAVEKSETLTHPGMFITQALLQACRHVPFITTGLLSQHLQYLEPSKRDFPSHTAYRFVPCCLPVCLKQDGRAVCHAWLPELLSANKAC